MCARGCHWSLDDIYAHALNLSTDCCWHRFCCCCCILTGQGACGSGCCRRSNWRYSLLVVVLFVLSVPTSWSGGHPSCAWPTRSRAAVGAVCRAGSDLPATGSHGAFPGAQLATSRAGGSHALGMRCFIMGTIFHRALCFTSCALTGRAHHIDTGLQTSPGYTQ